MAAIPETLKLALQHHQAGRLRKAEALYRRILREEPNHPRALHHLGILACQAGRYEAAIKHVGLAIQANPRIAAFHHTIGEACRAQGKLDAAVAHYRQALALKPAYAEAHNNLGRALWVQGKAEEAATHFRRALALKPAYAEAHNNLGVVLGTQGRAGEAATHFREALRLTPAFAEAHNNLGNVLRTRGNPEEAVAHYREALRLMPAYPEVYNNLGTVLQEQGKLKEAAAHYRQAVKLKPAYPEAYTHLGNVLREQRNTEQAVVCYRKALALDAACVPAHRNLGAVLREQGKVDEALAHFRQAASTRPSDGLRILAATILPVIAESKQHLAAARRDFEQRLAELGGRKLSLMDPVREVGTTNFYLAYHGRNDRDLQVAMAQIYERACPSLLYRAPHCHARPRRKADKIRIGFISKFLMSHSIGKTTRGVFAKLSRDRFSVHAIFVPPVASDEFARFFQQKADKTLILPGDLQAARERIAAEELDILFYQDIGMDPFTYFLAFARLAPVQCLSSGHPVTSGIRNLDYYISSDSFEPPDGDDHYSERLIRLKAPFAYYHKPAVPDPLKPRSRYGLADDEHLYICPQTLFKVHPDFDGLLSRILRADPRGRLVLINGKAAHWTELLLRRFQRTMPDTVRRVTVMPPQSGSDFINLIALSDVMLDTIHFSGYNTSMEAFAAGTPIVTLPGEFQRGRQTLGMYRKMGIPDCVASSPEQYVDIALRLGTDPAFRAEVRGRILARNHVLYEDPEVIREFERFFEQAVAAPASRPAPGMRVAVVTPYCTESEEVLRRCHQSVLAQSHACVHFLVADGRPADFVRAWAAEHITLAERHDDYGNTPRAVGSRAAVDRGFDAIAYLDADNWFQPDHIASLVALHRTTGAAVCASGRTFHRPDGSLLPLKEPGDGTAFVDTSCLFLTREAFRLVPVWELMPKQLSPICDRVFWQAVVKGKVSHAQTGLATSAYQTRYEAHYRTLREQPPDGAKPPDCQASVIAWWSGLSAAERKRVSARLGYPFRLQDCVL